MNKNEANMPKTRRIKPAHVLPGQVVDAARRLVEGDYEQEIALIKRRLPAEEGLFLDIGVGTGETLRLFEESSFVGLEIDARSIKKASAKASGRFVMAQAERLPFADGVFSAVVMCKIGHHLGDAELEKTVSESLRVLKRGGRVVFLDPEPPSSKRPFAHNLIAALEVGSCHRTLEETAAFFQGFEMLETERFRKKQFDFYVAVFKKRDLF
jgi:SAM-dependent methyltransferase